MKEETFDYIYDLLFFNDEEGDWWDFEGYDKLRNYLDLLNELALEALLKFSKSWSPSIRFNLAEAIYESKIERSLEMYCEIFIGMELDDLAHCMSGKLEFTESTDLSPEMYRQFREKMKEIEKYDNEMREELKENGKIIHLGKRNKTLANKK